MLLRKMLLRDIFATRIYCYGKYLLREMKCYDSPQRESFLEKLSTKEFTKSFGIRNRENPYKTLYFLDGEGGFSGDFCYAFAPGNICYKNILLREIFCYGT